MKYTYGKFKNKKGFTLIELLVVIAIIGVLASTVLASLNTARLKARDARRAADVRQINLAMNFYADSTGGTYPSSAGAWRCLGHTPAQNCWGVSFTGLTALNDALLPYLPVIPDDPRNNTSCSAGDAYLYHSNIPAGQRYVGAPAGAYIHWYYENSSTPGSLVCAGGVNAGSNSCGPYCELWVGPGTP